MKISARTRRQLRAQAKQAGKRRRWRKRAGLTAIAVIACSVVGIALAETDLAQLARRVTRTRQVRQTEKLVAASNTMTREEAKTRIYQREQKMAERRELHVQRLAVDEKGIIRPRSDYMLPQLLDDEGPDDEVGDEHSSDQASDPSRDTGASARSGGNHVAVTQK